MLLSNRSHDQRYCRRQRDVCDRLNEARSLRESLEAEFAALESEIVIALHPKIAIDYSREVETLNRAPGDNQNPKRVRRQFHACARLSTRLC
jgi:hypothetical protein